MENLLESARRLVAAPGDDDAVREFTERVTFASVEEIVGMLDRVLADDWLSLPPWARNLAHRLACLQRPDDAALLRRAAADLLAFGPDWDDQARRLEQRAEDLDVRG